MIARYVTATAELTQEVERYKNERISEVREAVASALAHHDLRDLVHAPECQSACAS